MTSNKVVREVVLVVFLFLLMLGCALLAFSLVTWRPRGIAKQSRVVMEIDQLHQAIQSYKEKHLAYPPSMSEVNLTARRVHFMRHVRTAFTNANYGTAEENFNTLRNQIATNFGAGTQGYNYKNAAGQLTPLDLDTLDQAEAIVFWLGGFPKPYNTANQTTIANRRIFGFHRDLDAPFKRDTLVQEGADPCRYRTELMYQFDETRLVDLDDDGWLEYSPLPPSSSGISAPYVYFDADTYSVSTSATGSPLQIQLLGYPRAGDPNAGALAAKFGLAVPLAQFVDPTNTSFMLWQNPENFQILCAGLDEKFSDPVTGDLADAYRVPVFPKGQVYYKDSGYLQMKEYTGPEFDNLSNMSKETLGAAASDVGRIDADRPKIWKIDDRVGLGAMIAVLALFAAWRVHRAQKKSLPCPPPV